jgi:hypothetical protein
MRVSGVDSNHYGGGEDQNYPQNKFGNDVWNRNIHLPKIKEYQHEELSAKSHGVYQ